LTGGLGPWPTFQPARARHTNIARDVLICLCPLLVDNANLPRSSTSTRRHGGWSRAGDGGGAPKK